MKFQSQFFMLLAASLFFSCQYKPEKNQNSTNFEKDFVLQIHHQSGKNIPANLKLEKVDSVFSGSIKNAQELLVFDTVVYKNDSLYCSMPLYNAFLIVNFPADTPKGFWYQPEVNHRRILISFEPGNQRFNLEKTSFGNAGGRYEAKMRLEKNPYSAIAEFHQNGQQISGTFIANSGDLRFLEGAVDSNKIMLSTFDGTVAYLIEGTISNDTLHAIWYSGQSAQYSINAFKNDDFELSDADEIIGLKNNFTDFPFKVASLHGDSIDYNDSRFLNKVRIIQITGSWCPNCKDEGILFAELHHKYQAQGLEILAVSFERSADLDKVLPAIQKYQSHLQIPYQMAFGGKAQKDEVLARFPALADFYAYPTSIFVDRKGKVRKIHTGFRGPGTSDYKAFVFETNTFIENLLQE